MYCRDMKYTYLPAFKACTAEAQSVMCSYNAVNGVPACANKHLLQQTLRQHWQYQGLVVSDCGAVQNIASFHHYNRYLEHAARNVSEVGNRALL